MSNLQKRVLVVQGKHGAHRQTFWVANELPKEQRTLRFSDGERTKPKNETVAPKDRVTISYGMLFSKAANEGINHALTSIGKVHSVPAGLHTVPIKVAGSLEGANGVYTLWSAFGPNNKIMVSKWASGPAATTAHEYGHFLDHHLLGNGQPSLRGMATVKWALQEPPGAKHEIAPLMNALYRSQAARSLLKKHEENERNQDHRHLEASQYLLMPPEMFARAYNQYIGLRASSQIARETRQFQEESWDRHGYQAQWTDEDFAPIAREFDRLFERRGLRRRRAQ